VPTRPVAPTTAIFIGITVNQHITGRLRAGHGAGQMSE
jgi:hypothetical protein